MEFISHLDAEAKTAHLAAELGLPEGSTMREVNECLNRQAAARYIDENNLPLPEDSSWGTILAHQTAASATLRAAELGLPEGANWRDITHHQNLQINPNTEPTQQP